MFSKQACRASSKWFIGLSVGCVAFIAAASHAQVVRFDTSVGDFDVNLFGDQTPGTVENFLTYVESGSYAGTIVHRSVGNFVVQGGGFKSDRRAISTNAPILNEPGVSNQRGTIGMAKLSGDVNSATSQWYINIGDNSFLDAPANGAFTAFGAVMGDGMLVVDKINALTTSNQGGVFAELPLLDPANAATADNMVVINRIYLVPEPAACSMTLIGLAIVIARRRHRRVV